MTVMHGPGRPPDFGGTEVETHRKPYTKEERENARRLIKEAKRRVGLDNHEKPKREKQKQRIGRALPLLLQDAKHCYEYFELQERDCKQPWERWKNEKQIKCYWCERFEYERNEYADEKEPKHILED